MNAAQISRARAVAEESEDGQLIRDLCDALDNIRALHPPMLKDGNPVGCLTCDWDHEVSWPCRTLKAVS